MMGHRRRGETTTFLVPYSIHQIEFSRHDNLNSNFEKPGTLPQKGGASFLISKTVTEDEEKRSRRRRRGQKKSCQEAGICFLTFIFFS